MLLPAQMISELTKRTIAVTMKAVIGVVSLLITVTFMPKIEEDRLRGKNIIAIIVTT